MDGILKKTIIVFLLIVGFAFITSVSAQNVGTDAPTFKMYQYEDEEFNTDTVYGKKVVTFVFGSIT